ncbi:MAG TPA: PAS domain-containing sensor histidine kinase [Streptosporangiaceae bacterium]|nr:PAS domain-containing sensor histidine kinase [Streptosporangiaceae bacterium]
MTDMGALGRTPGQPAGESLFTRLMEDEACFKLLSEVAPVGIVQTDTDGTLRFVNDTWSGMTGIPASEAIGKNWRSTVHQSDVWRLDAIRDESGADDELATDCRLRTAGGEDRWVHVVVRRVLDAQGNLTGRVAALTDVNARKLLEVAGERDRRLLAEQNLKLRDLDEARRRYLATVSHELRTPLTSIVSFVELIKAQESALSAESADYLGIVQRNAERLLRVVSDLLDLEGLEEGLTKLELRPVSVPELARESVRTSWATAAIERVRLELSAEDGPDVRADGNRLLQVMDNLIANAIKFTAEGGSVAVRASHDAAEWRIEVSDSGIGIPPEEVDHLFDRFFRASNARRERVPGTGLGLPTAKAITELHGGKLEVESTVGSGTTFTVCLPIGGKA